MPDQSSQDSLQPTKNTESISNIPQNPPPKQPRLYRKTIEAIKLIAAGLSPREALQAAAMTTQVSAQAVCALKIKAKKYSLTEPSTVHLASNQIKRILKARAREEAHTKVTKDGEVIEYTDKIYPTDSNILAAAGMVYDRYEPVQAQEQGQGQGNTYIDLSEIKVLITQDKGV